MVVSKAHLLNSLVYFDFYRLPYLLKIMLIYADTELSVLVITPRIDFASPCQQPRKALPTLNITNFLAPQYLGKYFERHVKHRVLLNQLRTFTPLITSP